MANEVPRLRVEIGRSFYDANVDLDEGAVEIDEWIITAIRNATAHAIRKTDYTWVKLGTKTGDYGWAKNIDDYCRRKFPVVNPPANWAVSKAAAYGNALPAVDAAIKSLTKIRGKLAGQRTKARGRAK